VLPLPPRAGALDPNAMGLGTMALASNSSTSSELNLFLRGLGEGVYHINWNGSSWATDFTLDPGAMLGLSTLRQHEGRQQLLVRLEPVSAESGSAGTPLRGMPSTATTTSWVVARTSNNSLVRFVLSAGVWTIQSYGGTFAGTPTFVGNGSWARTSGSTLWFNNNTATWTWHGGWLE
jgi:hypothetical protein